MLFELCTENAHHKVVLDFWHKTPQANKQLNNALNQSLSYLFIFSLNELLIYTSTSKCTRKGAR